MTRPEDEPKPEPSVGEFELAANLLGLTDARYRDAAAGTREAILDRD